MNDIITDEEMMDDDKLSNDVKSPILKSAFNEVETLCKITNDNIPYLYGIILDEPKVEFTFVL